MNALGVLAIAAVILACAYGIAFFVHLYRDATEGRRRRRMEQKVSLSERDAARQLYPERRQ